MLSESDATVAWASYFENLATPKDNPEYDPTYKSSVESMFRSLCTIHAGERSGNEHILNLTGDNITHLIGSMKNNKAADLNGLACEHLKYSHPVLGSILASLFNEIVRLRSVPTHFKHGVITPVFKQKNSDKDPDNYRRITVTSTIGKLFEKVLVSPTKSILVKKLNRLQRGFCSQSSSINTAFIISEAAAEAKDCKQPLFTTYLDASKAFDVVYHASMLLKLHHLGITGELWQLYRSLYDSMTSQVKWSNLLSRSILELQGVRQGGIPSTELFKARCNDLLEVLSTSGLGYSIGSVDVSAPTCADDMTLLSDKAINLQSMINLAAVDSNRERYNFSTKKTRVMVMNSNVMNAWNESPMWKLGERTIDITTSELHLGITRTSDCKAKATVQLNIQKARRAGYALMGAGVYGLNGLHVRTNLKIFMSYQMPRLLYGLEVLPLLKGDKDALDLYHRTVLKHLQHLPSGTSTAAVYLTLGQLPASAILARNTLTLYVSMLRDPAGLERQIIERQLAVKTMESKSWIVTVKELLLEYDLPSAYELFNNPPSKRQWKCTLKDKICCATFNQFKVEARRMASLGHMNIDACKPDALHPVWCTVMDSPHDIVRACTKVRVLTGQYRLQCDIAKQSGGSPVCQLCHQHSEDLPHFLLTCSFLHPERVIFIDKLKNILPVCRESDTNFIQIIIDCTMPPLRIPRNLHDHIETLSRSYIYAIHTKRSTQLKPGSRTNPAPS